MRHLSTRFMLIAFLSFYSLPVDAQDTARAPSQTLLRRLAEAVDGHRTGENVWVVARYDSLNKVVGVFPSENQARAAAGRSDRNVGIFGPYRSEITERLSFPMPDPNPEPGCWHNGLSDWIGICPESLIRLADVESMTLSIRLRDGTTRTQTLPGTADAIFLSMAAIDKFVIPYYHGVLGVEAAAAMRRNLVGRMRSPR